MKRTSHEYLLGQSAATEATASLGGRELPADLVGQVANLTVGELFYVLSHIHKLGAQAPVTAQALLVENPQICHALLHAECLAGMIDEPLLPVSADELRRAKSKARQIQEELEEHELPQPMGAADKVLGSTPKARAVSVDAPMSKFPARVTSLQSKARPAVKAPPPKAAPCSEGTQQPVPPVGSAPAPVPASGGGEDAKQNLIHKLVQLSPEEIGRLNESTKRQLLQFLQQHSLQQFPGTAG